MRWSTRARRPSRSCSSDYEEEYELAPELRPDGERRESLVQAAQIEVGLRATLLDGGFGAFTDTFEDLGRLRQLPGIAVQRLMADGYGFGAEGDWKTALLLRVLKVMARGLSGGTSFMEDYVYHLGPGPAKVLGAHMLEICPSIAARAPLVRDPPALDRRPRGSRAPRLHRAAGPGGAGLPHRYRRSPPARGQPGGRRGAR